MRKYTKELMSETEQKSCAKSITARIFFRLFFGAAKQISILTIVNQVLLA